MSYQKISNFYGSLALKNFIPEIYSTTFDLVITPNMIKQFKENNLIQGFDEEQNQVIKEHILNRQITLGIKYIQVANIIVPTFVFLNNEGNIISRLYFIVFNELKYIPLLNLQEYDEMLAIITDFIQEQYLAAEEQKKKKVLAELKNIFPK